MARYDWTRDELILALDLYFDDPSARGNKNHPEVVALPLTLAAMISLQRHTSAADAAIPCLLHPHPKGAV